jgi:hypothetical protein
MRHMVSEPHLFHFKKIVSMGSCLLVTLLSDHGHCMSNGYCSIDPFMNWFQFSLACIILQW